MLNVISQWAETREYHSLHACMLNTDDPRLLITILSNSSLLFVPFLNLMSNIKQRAGHVRVSVGGNTQETASLVASLADGKILEKDYNGVSNPVRRSL